jgi:diguanylate cyclase (GGDEF)-like protein
MIGATTLHNGPSSPSGVALQGLHPVVVDDLSDPPASLEIAPIWAQQGVRSGVWVPITTVRQQTFGVLTVHSDEVARFSRDDIHFLEAAANVVGSAIERARSEDLLAYQAFHDPLTDLPNRMLFADRLTNALARLERRGSKLAVLFLDIDHFKLVNDSAGHVQGDAVLIEVATRLQKALRAGDTLARFGGDEFVVLCEDVLGEIEAIGLADRLVDFTRHPIVVGGVEHALTISTGVALASSHDTVAEDLLRDADAAMYQAKAEGRARVTMFTQNLRARVLHRVDTEADLRKALLAGELRVYYQPVADVATGVLTGVEALVRWQHPERGLILPLEFIGVAEESGLIVPLGEFVLGEASRQLRQWHVEFPELAHLDMAVNLSARQLSEGDLPEVVANILKASGLDPSSLVLEITESVLMRDAEASIVAVRALTALGIRISIDDLGPGAQDR